MDYDAIFATQLNQLKEDGNYRIFAELERQSGAFPKAKSYDNEAPNEVTVWCSNDYLGTVSYTHLTLPTNREV